MKKKYFLIGVAALLLVIFFLFLVFSSVKRTESITVTYPSDQTIYPKDMASPTFAWKDINSKNNKWLITLKSDNSLLINKLEASVNKWKPSEKVWKSILAGGSEKKYTITVQSKSLIGGSKATVSFSISSDPVDASIFYRSVPLPFKFARENMKRIKWYMGDISSNLKPHAVLQDMPVCANCHSFSANGKTIGMDVDAIDDKGAYALSSFQENTRFASDSIMSWSKFQTWKFTYGLLSQVSPDGRYVVSTLHDCEIFVDRKDLEYSQLFFPFKGVLAVYDRKEKKYFELQGANDTMFVQSNPTWTPDGKTILFARAKAKHFNESGIHNGSVAKQQDQSRYKKFEKSYLDRDSLFKFDIYEIPFNDGKGGKARPLVGASNNGLSNYFPKVSPDGKWLVFCQAESFMLLQKDSKLAILPITGGKPRLLNGNSENMNSWHSWSPNSKWIIFSSKMYSPYTQLLITHINNDGSNTPPVYLDNFSFDKYAANIPEFVNTKYNKNLKIGPDFLEEDDFIIRHGEIVQNEGDEQHAYLTFDEAISKFPKNSEAYYKRGRILFKRNQFAGALQDLNKAIDLDKQLKYFVSRGIIFLKTGDNQAAIKDLNIAIKMDSTDKDANTYMGVAYTDGNKPDLAIPFLKKAIRYETDDYYSYYYLGLAYFDKKNYVAAEAAFTSGISYCNSDTYFPNLYELRGNCFAKTGRLEEAISDFGSAIKYSPNDPVLYYEKGKALVEMGSKQEGIVTLQQAEQLGSKEATALLRNIR